MATGLRGIERRAWHFAVVLAAGLLIAACHARQPLGPPTPTGATILGGPTMTSTPPPPGGWKLNPATPSSQQQAQDTVLKYLKNTLDALPPGIVFDASRYSGGTGTVPCGDAPLNTNPPEEFYAMTEVKPASAAAGGPDSGTLISAVGDIWTRWGWWVYERDDFRKPNRFGYAPDGYKLQIESANPTTYPPTITGTSPCFPHDVARNDLPFPTTITAGPAH